MHYKQKKYYYYGIVLPLKQFRGRMSTVQATTLVYDAHTPEGEGIQQVQLYIHEGINFINRETPHVIYQSEDNEFWAREVDDFFGIVNVTTQKVVKRFEKINNEKHRENPDKTGDKKGEF
ncbi:hypothetical protein [Bacillus toyonensis]|uniref:hypothetical protein n=1 Tax=Bacillus toyonensis TaxID=155322 RepID=UPI000BFC78FE|nr:hypothetical protein [Bacillus toyonensis]PHG31316.1 hypothetical protein COI60_22850 [Bacillus toyonensis]